VSQVLVTGANGFVGSRLCRLLVERGYEVCAALRRSCPHDDHAGQEQVIVGDVGSDTRWGQALHDVDCVVHLAARVHVMNEAVADPLAEFRRVNVEGTLNLARQAVSAGVKRFVFISSIKVNGESTSLNQPFTAEDTPAPVDPYGISKYETEEGLRSLATETGMEVVIIRPPLVYGPGVKANFLNMMQWLNRGIPLPLGAIHNKRSLIALDNFVDLIITCIEHPAAANQTFLAGDGEDLSTTELLQRMGRALGRHARLIPVPARLLEAAAVLVGRRALAQRLCGSLQVDISKVRDLLGWKPIVTIDEALEKTAKAYLGDR
jgi:nucleoside-diphosphate-sugar epimerase